MTNPEHERLRDWAGAYTLGALDPDERRTFETHLRTCRDCQTEVRALAPLPGLLAGIDPADIDDAPDGALAARIERRARAELGGIVTSRRRWRAIAVLAGVAAALLLVVVLWPGPADRAVELAIGDSSVEAATIRAEPRGWGTELHVELDGLPTRPAYRLWTIDRDGSWVVAATWGPTPTGGARVTGATSASFPDVRRVVVTSLDRDDVIVDAAPSG